MTLCMIIIRAIIQNSKFQSLYVGLAISLFCFSQMGTWTCIPSFDTKGPSVQLYVGQDSRLMEPFSSIVTSEKCSPSRRKSLIWSQLSGHKSMIPFYGFRVFDPVHLSWRRGENPIYLAHDLLF